MAQVFRLVVLLLTACCLFRAAPAHAQFFSNPMSPGVMSSRELNALLDAVGFDPAQRAAAGPLFDRAQQTQRVARDELADVAPPPSADARALAAHESRVRRAYEQMRSAQHDFFEGLNALAREDQRPQLERARLAVQRRLMRQMLHGSPARQGPVRTDLIDVVRTCRLSPEDLGRALAVLEGYETRLNPLLQQAFDLGLAVPAKVAKLREEKGIASSFPPPPPGADGPGFTLALDAPDDASREGSAAFNAIVNKLVALHLQGMAELDAHLGMQAADPINMAAARRLWPRTMMDARSPRTAFARAIQDLARGNYTLEQQEELRNAQRTWLTGWWSATRKACDAEHALRAFGPFGELHNEARELRAAMHQARLERDGVNRTAWRVLAALDPDHPEFYAPLIAEPASHETGTLIMAGGSDPVPPRTGGNVGGTIEMIAPPGEGDLPEPIGGPPVMGSAVIVMTRSTDEDEPVEEHLIFPAILDDAVMPLDPSTVSISIGADGMVSVDGSPFDDGMDAPVGNFGLGDDPGRFELDLSGARLPTPVSRDKVQAIATALGAGPAEMVVIDQLHADYMQAVDALDQETGAAARRHLTGAAVGVVEILGPDGGPSETLQERSSQELRAAMARLDAYTSHLGQLDDALAANLAAACTGSREGAGEWVIRQASLLRDEFARHRLHTMRYPCSPMLQQQLSTRRPLDLAAILRQASLGKEDREVADAIMVEWSAAMLGAMEQARATLRKMSPELLEVERRMFDRIERVRRTETGMLRDSRVSPRDFSDHEVVHIYHDLMREAAQAEHAGITLTRQALDRLLHSLSPAGRTTLVDAWCRAVAPQAFADKRNAGTTLEQALGRQDLSPQQRSQLEELRAQHQREHAELTLAIGLLAADLAYPDPAAAKRPGPPQASLETARARKKLQNLRFDRSELNERTLRKLKVIEHL